MTPMDSSEGSTTEGQLEHDGLTRSWLLHMPPVPLAERDAPRALVVSLHGGGGNARTNMRQTGFNAVADREGFVVVHPDGTGAARPLLNAFGKGRIYTWNAGSCCGHAAQQQVDDVGFISALIARLQGQMAIDPNRIFVSGFSNGGMLAYRLACETRGIFAAAGIVSAAHTSALRTPEEPVSIIHIHGTADQNVTLAGGRGAKALDPTPKPPVMDGIQFWLRANGLAANEPQRSERGAVRSQRWTGGTRHTELAFHLIDGGGHAWPGGDRLLPMLDEPSNALDATSLIWDFFKAHPKH